MHSHPYRIATIKISIPAELKGRCELRMPSNPENTRPAYGMWSKLATDLLTDWVTAAERELDLAHEHPEAQALSSHKTATPQPPPDPNDRPTHPTT